MSERIEDLPEYLKRLDAYVERFIDLIEAASNLYGEFTDRNLTEAQFSDHLDPLSDKSRELCVEIGNFVIDDLAPDSFQDLDSAFEAFTGMCDNYIMLLSDLSGNESGNHWLIKNTVNDCQEDYKKLLEYRRNPEIIAIAECLLPQALKLDPQSRVFEAMRLKLQAAGFVCTELELSGEAGRAQLNIGLVTSDTERPDLLDLAFRCLQVLNDDLSSLSRVTRIFLSFRVGNRPPYSWLRLDKEKILSLLLTHPSPEGFEEVIDEKEFLYSEHLILPSQRLEDLAEHSPALTEDFAVTEALIEASEQLEIIKRASSDSNQLTDFILRWSLSHSLLNCVAILLQAASVTKDQDAAQTVINLFDMYRPPDEVHSVEDYSTLSSKVSDLVETLRFRYVVIPNVRKVSLGSRAKACSRIALVQPQISLDHDYQDFRLTPDGVERHLEVFRTSLAQASQNGVDVIAFPELFFPTTHLDHLKRQSEETDLIVITGLDYEYEPSQSPINSCAVSLPDGRLGRQAKLFRSKYDHPSISGGDELSVFTETPIGDFSVFICYDYLSAEELVKLQGSVDALFVLALNPDISTYHQKALADAYSNLYGFICIVNAFDPHHTPPIMGGSGCYGPLRNRKVITRFEEGEKGLRIVELPLRKLRKARGGRASTTMKSLPAGFKDVSLSRDYPEEEIKDIRKKVQEAIKESKRRALWKDKKNYESLKESYISHDLEADLDRKGYAIMELEPAHVGLAKRQSAFILIKKGLPKSEVKAIIQAATEEVKNLEIYSNERQEARYKGRLAGVVWLYVFNERRHRRHLIALDHLDYFVCRTQWVRRQSGVPFPPMDEDEWVGNIAIKWNANYPK